MDVHFEEIVWALVLGLAGVYSLISLLWNRHYKKPKGLPPGTMGWPLIGETLEFTIIHASRNPDAFMYKRKSRHRSNVFASHLFGKPTIISADPDMNKFVLQNEGKYFRTSYPKSLIDILGKHNLTEIHGDLHRRLHNLVVSFVSPAKLRDYLREDVETYVQSMFKTWENRSVVYVQEESKMMTFSLIAKQFLSLPPGEKTDRLRKEYSALVAGLYAFPIPLPGTTYSKAIRARQNILKFLTDEIRERRGSKIREYNDVLAALLVEKNEDGLGALSDEQIADITLGLLIAGHETTATTMALAVKYLTDCPKALQRLREENIDVRNRKAGDMTLTWDDYKSLPFTQTVINETLRLSSIAPYLFREVTEEIEIKGYTFPKGWRVMPYLRGVHMDPSVYKDAKQFNPWRWESRVPTADFMPFGGGPRLCAGFELARLELSCFLHHLVTRFRWEPLEDDHVVSFPITTLKKKLPVVVKPLIEAH